jgi:cell division transport system ATP-binding protein
MEDRPYIEIVKVTKTYPPNVMALRDISLSVNKGEMIFLTGPSGAGKTTLLKLLCWLETPTKGIIEINGKDLLRLRPHRIQKMRQKIGMAYQDFKLLPRLTVFQNIAMAMEVTYKNPKTIRRRIPELLNQLQIGDKIDKPAGQLSRGEQQRVAIARAAANAPPLLLADEPTGNLDPEMTRHVISLFNQLNQAGTTIVIATHDKSIYNSTSHRVINLQKGRLSSSFSPENNYAGNIEMELG